MSTELVWERLAPRGGLRGLMNLWESNFLLLQQLLPTLNPGVEAARSVAMDDAPLYLEVLERNPYTLTLLLTYRLPERGETPKLRVRVYRDARIAQALDAQPSGLGQHLQRQWERNMLLNKWLDYCLAKGHGFALAGLA